MAGSDTTVVFSGIDESIVWSDYGGVHTLTVPIVKGQLSWTVENPPKAEMMPRGQHHSTPTVRKTGDGKVTGSIKIYCSSFVGNSAKTPYEVLTDSAGWTTVGAGDGAMIKQVVTYNATAAGGAQQTAAFNYCTFSNVAVGLEDGLYVISADFEDRENKPTITGVA